MRNNYFDFEFCYNNGFGRCNNCCGCRYPSCRARGGSPYLYNTEVRGPMGPQGPIGPQGPQGPSATIYSALITSSGAITVGATVPLTTQINTSQGEISVNATANAIVLTQGLYKIEYAGVGTGATGDVELSIYVNGIENPTTISSSTLATATDFATLSGTTLLNIVTATTVDLRNSGDVEFTLNNLSITITKLA